MEENRTRTRIFITLVCVAIGILVLRLGKLQILDTSEYSGESRSNAIREHRVLPARGAIYDRNGELMVDNEPAYTLLVTPRYFDETRIPLLASLLEVPDTLLSSRLDEARRWSPFRQSMMARGVGFDALARVLENRRLLAGITHEADQKRKYLSRARASHVLGYVRQISDNELKAHRRDGYRSGDLIGQSGLERTYERTLRGSLGSEFNVINVRGQVVESYRNGAEDSPPVSGYNLHLTIDSEIQALAESLFVDKRGAAVALDPNNGEILAMVSAPDFDLDLFSRRVSPETWSYLYQSEDKPIFNRATSSYLPPGSAFKPFIAMMALQEGVITPTSTVTCRGYHPRGGPNRFRCMHVHGTIAVQEAIAESCNTFFFEMMNRIDVETFSRYGHAFGFGELARLDIGEQQAGLIPDSAYFNRVHPGWNVGTPMNLGIGQGDMGVTPLQLARYMAAIGNGGELVPLHLVSEAVQPATGDVMRYEPGEESRIPISPRFMTIVKNGLKEVIEKTSPWLAIPGIKSAGKTGTAQNPRGEDDAVFIMFAPFDNPQIAIAVMVENAGFGSMSAGPIASFMAEQYLTGTIDRSRNWLFQRVLDTKSGELPEKTSGSPAGAPAP